jgi:shikimate dehydrogenase
MAMTRPGASTRVFALLGEPVRHSLSPLMQNAAFRAAGLDAVYVAIPCAGEDLPALMRSLGRQGGGGNVTIPHKGVAAQIGVADERVAQVGAANVFVGQGEELHLGNSDVDGISAVVNDLVPGATRWLIVGTGGSARAAVGAAIESGAAVAIQSRDAARGARFGAWITGLGGTLAQAEQCEVVVNATPLGLHPVDPPPLDLAEYPALVGVVDLTYQSDGSTAWVRQAQQRGLAATDGREMLLRQGAAAWRWWFPGVTPPIEVMRAALKGRMG